MLFPLPPYEPDRSRFNPEATQMVQNARPTRDGWGPIKAFNPVSAALPAKPLGGVAVQAANGLWRIFAATATNLYEASTTDYTWTEISRVTDDYALADGAFWSFWHYGNYLIATAVGSTFPQFIELDAGTQFANLTNATFEAELVFGIGGFLVFARIDGDDKKLKWSGVENIEFWTPGEEGSDEQILPNGGRIQAGLPQEGQAIILQEQGLRAMVLDTSSHIAFRFTELNPTRGAFAGRSVVNIGQNDFVYLAKDGFYRGIQGQPIGAGKVDHTFLNDLVAGDKLSLVSGFADPYEKQVYWRYEDENGDNHIIGYDWQWDRWFFAEIDVLELFSGASKGYTLEELDTFGTLETLPYGLDSIAWKGGVPGLLGFDSTFKLGFFDGNNLEATIDTERKSLNWPRRAITNRITVLCGSENAQIAISPSSTQAEADSFGSYLSRQTGQPFINSRVNGRWHKFRVKIPASETWDNCSAVDVAFTDGGGR